MVILSYRSQFKGVMHAGPPDISYRDDFEKSVKMFSG